MFVSESSLSNKTILRKRYFDCVPSSKAALKILSHHPGPERADSDSVQSAILTESGLTNSRWTDLTVLISTGQ